MENPLVIGWKGCESLADDLMKSSHWMMMDGELLFAYRSNAPSNTPTFFQITIVANLREDRTRVGDLAVSTITSGYTSYFPHASFEYIDKIVLEDLKTYKVDKNIIEEFKKVIEKFYETPSN